MSVNPELRALKIDLPAQPEALVKLSLLLATKDINLQAVSALIEADMALASAVLKAVNSSLYGLKGRVQSAQQAITYIGLREVAGIAFEIGLRAAFPPAPELQPVWQRAARRGLLMGRLATALSLDAWAAHSAGLFEECGKAALFRHAPDHYRSMLRAAANDVELVELEHAGFGVSHDALGAALCESWGLSPAVVASVRLHVQAQATLQLAPPSMPAALHAPGRRGICALSVLAAHFLAGHQAIEAVVHEVAAQADLDPTLVLRALQRVGTSLAPAAAEAPGARSPAL